MTERKADALRESVISDRSVVNNKTSVMPSPYGADDEIGRLNELKAGQLANILLRVDPRRVYDLSVEYFIGMPSWTVTGDPPFQIWLTARPTGEILDDPMGVGLASNQVVSRTSDAISMFTHSGTHVDTLNHMGLCGHIYNGYTEQEHLGSRHWRVCGAEQHPPVISRGVMLDIAALHGVPMLPDSYGIGAADIEGAMRRQGVEVRPGDVVLVRSGRMSVWPDHERFIPNEPGLNLEGAKALADMGAIMIGADNLGFEQGPSADEVNWQVVHTFLLTESGIPIIELVNMEELSADSVYEFAFVGACLKIRGATGSPMRPLAIPLRPEHGGDDE
ncbi:MAG: cyclase [Actinomycetia bacterium]|nr:cyclase [Actinomycetes bacterium]